MQSKFPLVERHASGQDPPKDPKAQKPNINANDGAGIYLPNAPRAIPDAKQSKQNKNLTVAAQPRMPQ